MEIHGLIPPEDFDRQRKLAEAREKEREVRLAIKKEAEETTEAVLKLLTERSILLGDEEVEELDGIIWAAVSSKLRR